MAFQIVPEVLDAAYLVVYLDERFRYAGSPTLLIKPCEGEPVSPGGVLAHLPQVESSLVHPLAEELVRNA